MANTFDTAALEIGTTDAKALYNNASNFDDALNGIPPAWIDRRGVRRQSWAGLEAAIQQLLLKGGYVWIGDYAANLTFTARNQYTVRAGIAYRLAEATALPFTTTGNWTSDQGKFQAFQVDIILQGDLASSDVTKGVSLVNGAARYVSNFAALAALPNSVTQPVYTLGYYTPGDGGGAGPFRLDTDSSAPANGGTIAVTGSGTGRRILSDFGQINVRMFGARGDGSTDDTSAFSAAIAATTFLTVPPGLFVCGYLAVNKEMTIQGSGNNSSASVIRALSTSGDVFDFTASGTRMTQLYFACTSQRISGAYVRLRGFGGHRVHECEFWNGYDGAVISGSTDCRIYDSQFYSTTGSVLTVAGGFNHALTNIAANNPSTGQPIAGLRVTSVGDLTCTGLRMLQCGTGLLVDAADGGYVNSLLVNQSFFDTSTLCGRIRVAGTGQIQRVWITDTWFGSSQAQGLVISNPGFSSGGKVDGIFLTNVEACLNIGDGVEIGANCKNIHAVGGHFGQNSGSAVSVAANSEFYHEGGLVGSGAGFLANSRGYFISAGAVGQVLGTKIIGNSTQVTNGAGANFVFAYTPGYAP